LEAAAAVVEDVVKYAQKTEVSVEKSKGEIERTLQKYGADEFVSGWNTGQAVVAFRMSNRRVRFILPLPNQTDREFTRTPGRGKSRTKAAAMVAWEQACRQRWRALKLVIQAKLEAVESGITTFENEFMAHIVLPDGRIVGDHVLPAIEEAYAQPGRAITLLPDFSREHDE
jgi:hypothetical protein